MENISLSLKNNLEKKGLVFLGVVPLEYRRDFDRFSNWIGEKKHAELKFLEENTHLRKDPTLLLEGAKSAIVVGLPYRQEEHWPMAEGERPRAAQYARFQDYHSSLRKICNSVLKETVGGSYEESQWRVLVDSAPVLERALAAKTGEGFIGKNTCFIHPSRGSFFLLAEILTTHDLPVTDATIEKACGTCTLCQIHCPTDALGKDYEIDSRRCLSYWTIEHRGTIPEEFWPWLSKYYFGCDICQIVCPYNEVADNVAPKWVAPREFPDLYEVATMDQKKYEAYFGGTPMTRAKRSGLIRNALIALTVTRDPRLESALETAGGESEPVVRDTLKQIRKWRTFRRENTEYV